MNDGAAEPAARRATAVRLVEQGRLQASLPLWRDEAVSGEQGSIFVRAAAVEAMAWHDLQVAGALAEIYTATRWSSAWWPGSSAPYHLDVPVPAEVPRPQLSLRKVSHDLDQICYLRSRGLVGPDTDAIVGLLQDAYERLAREDAEARVAPSEDDVRHLGPVYNRILHMTRAERLPLALDQGWDRELAQSLYRSPPGVVVIDDFLEPAALREVRRFCLESMVWSGTRYHEGRLGAFFVDGFNTPLLLQIAEEARAALPGAIGCLPLRQLWAFKASTTSSGVGNTHADFAAVNLNFWITPTESNADPDSGGLVIFNARSPLTWDFATYNERPDVADGWLQQRGARAIRVPYRQNRAVLFSSDLFHATEAVRFAEGYEHRRINITMLYGDRQGSAPAGCGPSSTPAASPRPYGYRTRLRA